MRPPARSGGRFLASGLGAVSRQVVEDNCRRVDGEVYHCPGFDIAVVCHEGICKPEDDARLEGGHEFYRDATTGSVFPDLVGLIGSDDRAKPR